jgi:hypothetical protein
LVWKNAFIVIPGARDTTRIYDSLRGLARCHNRQSTAT